MTLTIPSFPNPHDRNNPLTDAHARVSLLTIDVRNDTCYVEVGVHPNASASVDEPVQTLGTRSGTAFPNGHIFPRPSEMMANSAFAAAYATISAAVYAALKDHPSLVDAT